MQQTKVRITSTAPCLNISFSESWWNVSIDLLLFYRCHQSYHDCFKVGAWLTLPHCLATRSAFGRLIFMLRLCQACSLSCTKAIGKSLCCRSIEVCHIHRHSEPFYLNCARRSGRVGLLRRLQPSTTISIQYGDAKTFEWETLRNKK
jgi:hypothetical protein